MLTDLQKKTAQAIVNVFETGDPHGEYGQVTLLAGDSGHLTYGRSQTTLASGNLYFLVKAYTEAPEARFGDALAAYLERLKQRDTSLDHDLQLRRLLEDAGTDPVMQEVQDNFFDRVYWNPSQRSAQALGIEAALGATVVYDSWIHGSWGRMRDRTIAQHGTPDDIGEKAWLSHYVDVRWDWLATHANTLLHRTVYRMDAFIDLIDDEKWSLALPFHVRGVRLDEATLISTPLRVSAQDIDERLLFLQTPFMQGSDVEAVQRALLEAGIEVEMDGVFGPATEEAVEAFQDTHDLVVDGIVGPATRQLLFD